LQLINCCLSILSISLAVILLQGL